MLFLFSSWLIGASLDIIKQQKDSNEDIETVCNIIQMISVNSLFSMHTLVQIFFFLILTVEDGKHKEKPVQDPFPENRQRKENVRDLTEDSDAQRPSGEETMSECLNWLCRRIYLFLSGLLSTTSFCFVFQDKNKKVKVKTETPNAAPIYKFETKRKRWETRIRPAGKKLPPIISDI